MRDFDDFDGDSVNGRALEEAVSSLDRFRFFLFFLCLDLAFWCKDLVDAVTEESVEAGSGNESKRERLVDAVPKFKAIVLPWRLAPKLNWCLMRDPGSISMRWSLSSSLSL